VAASKFNTELTGLEAQATAHRDTVLSQNAATRATFQNLSDQHNMAMLDYTSETYISGYPMAINDLQAQHMLLGDFMKSDQGQKMIDLMREQGQWAQIGGIINAVLEGGKIAFGMLG
ncbi:hypothetical protein LCGC14_2623360, partial [marine sediment metagenome]